MHATFPNNLVVQISGITKNESKRAINSLDFRETISPNMQALPPYDLDQNWMILIWRDDWWEWSAGIQICFPATRADDLNIYLRYIKSEVVNENYADATTTNHMDSLNRIRIGFNALKLSN